MQKSEVFTIKIGGQAGQGIKSAGLIMAKFAVRSGYFVYNHTEYPSLIRGGHNTIQIGISGEYTTGPYYKLDLLIALNQETANKHLSEIKDTGALFYDTELGISTPQTKIKTYNLPIIKIAKEVGGEIFQNIVGLGMVVAYFQGDLEILKRVLTEQFAGKDQAVIDANIKAAETGYQYFFDTFKENLLEKVEMDPVIQKMIVNGNDAASLGAIAGGMQFSAIYPMSPISSMIQTLAENQEEYDYIFKQPEDEIAAVNMAVGASFAGVRSFTATSGGGFCLMAEGIGLAGMTETPLVVALGMRPGPATGLATWSDQGDLHFALHIAHGEFPRIVLAPGDVSEVFEMTRQAFNLAEKYQTPVIILLDKTLCENETSILIPADDYKLERGKMITQRVENYKRYETSFDGISDRSIPGVGNFFIANSYEHDPIGFATDLIPLRKSQMEKRMKKIETIEKQENISPMLFGPQKADLTLVSWGSNKGSILEALKNFENVNFLQITWMNPFPSDKVKEVLSKSKKVMDIECNFNGELATLIKEKTGFEIQEKLLKYDGRPFFVEEIIDKIKEQLK